jgi:protein gp37
MSKTTIEWTEYSWNPVTGCTKYSLGCQNCYAEKMALRLQAMGMDKYANGFQVTQHAVELWRPMSWRKPHMVFVCSMADLFHENVTDEFIEQVFSVMNQSQRHTFQVLTKRAERLASLAPQLNLTDNIWVGVTVETIDYVSRVDLLRQVPARVRFLSCEPLLGPLTGMDLDGIGWVLVGGESGPGARPMEEDWARELRDVCGAANVPFFYKQRGAKQGKGDSVLDGREHKAYPFLKETRSEEVAS